ncbi:MAG TPA: molecular chaperone HtpG [Chromatiales bacterium]|nr:molecular chaperone HtpG [Chromatiales bacterium]
MTTNAHKETLEFQTEVQQLLKLMIHSLYSNKEIFLRELISNASDACDKLRFEALSDDALYEDDTELKLRVSFDKEARTITIADNGIGMNRTEVVENIGTIAKSGTRQFFDSLSGDQAKDSQLIGQFGVGFYSAFIVADKVTLTTRRAGTGPEHGVRWSSNGEGSYELETVEKAERGTEVTLHLREDQDEFLDHFRLRSTINKYSDHISLPIMMPSQDEEKAGEYETVNSASALWARAKKDITEEEYSEFYKHVGHDFQDPLAYVHSHVEGNQSYTSLLYIPQRAPFDLWDREQKHGIKLYVKRVFIMDTTDQLMPTYLRFVRGVIDSSDLPLNVSRELLQHNRMIDTIRGASVKKVLGMLEGLAKNDAEKYRTFWEQFGPVLKEGLAEDTGNRERIAKLLRYTSTESDGDAQDVSLADYVSRMKEGQSKIYYVTADNYAAARNSPHLEIFKTKGIEVLLMSDRVDEWSMSYFTEFDGKPLQSVAKGSLELGELEDESEKEAFEKAVDECKELTTRMQEALGERVKEVRLTHRLTDSPSCLVVEEQEMAINMQKIMEAAGQKVPSSKPILEVNPQHPIVLRLKDEADKQRFGDITSVLFDQAMLSEGGQLDDPSAFVNRVNSLLVAAVA